MLKNMRIGLRMALAFGVLMILMTAMGLFAVSRLGALDDTVDVIRADKWPKSVIANDIVRGIDSTALNIRDALLLSDSGEIKKELRAAAETQSRVTRDMDALAKTIHSEEGKAILKELLDRGKEYAHSKNEIIGLIQTNMKQQATVALVSKLRPLQNKYFEVLNNFIKFQGGLMNSAGKDAKEAYRSSRTLVIVFLAGSLVLAVLIIFLVSLSITKPLSEAVAINRKLAEGDMSVSVQSERGDEVGQLFAAMKHMVDKFKSIITDINMLTEAAVQGKLAVRADVSRHEGDYKKIVQGINSTLDAVIGPLNVSAEYVDRISKGDIPPKITDEYKGDFNEIKINLNLLIDAMDEVTTTAEEIAGGNLRVKVKERSKEDKLMRALAKMVGGLTEVMSNIQSAAGQVMAGSQEISASAEQLSQGSTEQSSSVEEVSSSMEQMAANIKQNSDNAQQTEKIAMKAAEDGREGGRSVSETVAAMKEIAGKISIIEEIARQTNLLALNAAIEAARAGEHGKGFAVVASEVRKLAERSQSAAGEINKLSASSVRIAEKAGEMLTGMVPDIQRNADLVQEIAAASNEQSAGAEQINRAIQQLDQVIQQNAAASEEMASTSVELLTQAEQLQSTIAFFKFEGASDGEKQVRPHKTQPTRPPRSTPPKTNGHGHAHSANGIVLALGKEAKVDSADMEFERY